MKEYDDQLTSPLADERMDGMSMSDEANTDRYVLEVVGQEVHVIDTENPDNRTRIFSGSDRLINATREAEYLNSRALPSLADPEPAAFLAELPSFARKQRLQAMLTEVSELQHRYVTLLAEDARRLAEASSLARRLQEALARPLSSTLPAQNASEVGRDTLKPQNRSERLVEEARGYAWLEVAGIPPQLVKDLQVSKPMPY